MAGVKRVFGADVRSDVRAPAPGCAYLPRAPRPGLCAQSAPEATAEALRSLRAMPNTASEVHRGWLAAAASANEAVALAQRSLLGPLRALAQDVVGAASGTNCRIARDAYASGAESLGVGLVREQVVLWVCATLLSACALGLAAMFCCVWSMRQRGLGRPGRRWQQVAGVSSDEEGLGSGDEETVARVPLNKSWR